ncbi:MAG: Wzz/FepE/Etk N-terminal domain-containing protein [bacterium]|nr:Wzz/FepE/Etk N-terminal domain-containing protein [bacterium]
MTIQPASENYDDEIDLRAIFQTLWKARLPILIVTLAAALVAFAVSAWILPKQYEAVAYVTVSQPAIRYLTGPEGLAAVPAAPDIKALPELAQTKAILDQVMSDARVTPLLTSDGKGWSDKTQVSAVGTSQLRFQVTDTDPQRVAILATVWAEKAAEWIEVNYGLGAFTANLDAQISTTQQDYTQAQSDLEAFLAQDQTPILFSRLGAQKDIYACLERRVRAANSLLLRLGDFETRLVQSDDPLSLSDAILLVSIQQDLDSLETCGNPGTILQSSSPLLFTGLSSSRGMEVITGMHKSLQQRIANSQNEQDALQNDVLKLQVEMEQLDYERSEYTRQRDQAATLYAQLTFQQAVMENVLQQSGRMAQISVEAKAPQFATAPRVIMNTALAGMAGLMLAVFWALATDWWRNNGQAE